MRAASLLGAYRSNPDLMLFGACRANLQTMSLREVLNMVWEHYAAAVLRLQGHVEDMTNRSELLLQCD